MIYKCPACGKEQKLQSSQKKAIAKFGFTMTKCPSCKKIFKVDKTGGEKKM